MWRGNPREHHAVHNRSWSALESFQLYVCDSQAVFSISYHTAFRNGGATLHGSFQRQSTYAEEMQKIHAMRQGIQTPALIPPWAVQSPFPTYCLLLSLTLPRH